MLLFLENFRNYISDWRRQTVSLALLLMKIWTKFRFRKVLFQKMENYINPKKLNHGIGYEKIYIGKYRRGNKFF